LLKRETGVSIPKCLKNLWEKMEELISKIKDEGYSGNSKDDVVKLYEGQFVDIKVSEKWIV
jgi:hypothetical protein